MEIVIELMLCLLLQFLAPFLPLPKHGVRGENLSFTEFCISQLQIIAAEMSGLLLQDT